MQNLMIFFFNTFKHILIFFFFFTYFFKMMIWKFVHAMIANSDEEFYLLAHSILSLST